MNLINTYKADILAGLTVAVFLIPQAMAYALLAGLPASVGLYTCIVPLVIYAIIGTSPHVAMGPVALLSIMMASALSPLATAFENTYVSLAIHLTLLTGLIQVIMYVMKAGRLMKFVDKAVIHGFISGAGATIVLSQTGHMIGIGRLKGDNAIVMLKELYDTAANASLTTTLFSTVGCLLLFIMAKKAPKLPRAFIVVAISASMIAAGIFTGLSCIEAPKAWLPQFSMPTLTLETTLQLLPAALLISIVGYIESVSLATAFAEKTELKIATNREWLAIGTANIGSSMTGGMVVAAGFSRSAVKVDAGAKTKLTGICTVISVTIALVIANDALSFIPEAILGAMVAMSVYKLVNLKALKNEFLHSQRAGTIQLTTFIGVIAFGIVWGFIVGLTLDLIWRAFLFGSHRAKSG